MWTSKNRDEMEWDGTLKAYRFVGDGTGITGITAEASGAVSSVFGRQGNVIAVSGDYSHDQLTASGANTHAQIDSHIANTSNPHSVTEVQVLPSQTGNSGKYLTTNGSATSWGAVTATETDPIFNAASASYNTHIASSAIHFTSSALWTSINSVTSAHDTTSSAYYTHASDSTSPHGSLLTQTDLTLSNVASMAKVIVTGDFSTVSSAYVANVVLGTSATPPTASTFTIGSIYVQYTP